MGKYTRNGSVAGGHVYPQQNNADVEYNWINKGISLRDHIAIEAMKTLLHDYDRYPTAQGLARQVYALADAMLEVSEE